MKRVIAITFVGAALIWAGNFYWQNFRLAGPAVQPPPRDLAGLPEEGKGPGSGKSADPAVFPLKLPPGFAWTVFAREVKGARVLALDPNGNLLASLTSQGKVVALPDTNGDGVAEAAVTVLEGLDKPHGLAFGPGKEPRLYVAETGQVAAYDYDPERLTATYQQKIADLPPGGRHFTRSLRFLPGARDRRLLISVGSSCDACQEDDPRRAKILAVNPDGGDISTYASGLRNSVFMVVHPRSKHVWATEMGRDDLGDNWPPDEINIILEGSHYGWPYCYGKRLHDDKSDPTGAHREFCKDTIPSFIDIPAHSAPLGLAFFPAEWPREFRHDLLVALHGAANRTAPTGAKVVRYKLDAAGNFVDVENFITGWLTPPGALGRPVDILITPEGVIFISDDKAGVVYRVVYEKM
ncbi:MAG: PQQ-dependent sugar dehydrogenase [Proteobacteria bacterium]|nr:PQQ-dependent sugar dehydrogenase [Pseudomonadota bacterium]MBU4447785.1 PQQ-dependent sugar dehydrogenase [Pseudomonadota bacterium]MCG2773077.1 PQQ-dependent sugar dehydrogenase [Desulfobacterales bacterium]